MRTAYMVDEPSAWLRGTAGNRLRNLKRRGVLPTGGDVVVCPLGEPTKAGSREDRTCDRCRAYVPEGRPLWTFVYAPVDDVQLVGGLCARCTPAEVGDLR